MKKKYIFWITLLFFSALSLAFADLSKVTEADVIKLVDQAVKLIETQGEEVAI